MKTTILRQLVVLPVLAASMAGLYACGNIHHANGAQRAAAPAPFSNTYVLRRGGSAVITAATTMAMAAASTAATAPVLRLERINDSRCRAGAVCVWAGYISFSFALRHPDGSATNFVLSDNMPNGTPSVTRNGLNFTLAGFEPQQLPAKDETAPDYQVSLKVSNINSP
ncbi:hypothetical protein [Duganella sp. BuS-21]|uniref:hypothetical protein n=1 Tax=Duganella sp. BuS-21 TaxID=2943848 RepID=UPI0035A6EED4